MRVIPALILLLVSSSAFAQGIKVTLGGEAVPAQLRFAKFEDKPQVFLALRIPKGDVQSAVLKNGNGEELAVLVKSNPQMTLALLPSFAGELVLTKKDGSNENLEVRSENGASYFVVDKSCRLEGLRIVSNPKVRTTHFGGVVCQMNKKSQRLRLIFSTAEDSEWLGGDLFEVDGKGSRWKYFDLPLDGSKPRSTFRWGEGDNPSAAIINYRPKKPTQAKEAPPYFFVGGELFQQSLSAMDQTANWMSAAIRLDVLYPLNDSWRIRGGGGYLLYSLASSEDSEPKYQQFRLNGDYVFKNDWFLSGGYDMLSFSSAKPSLVVDFEAPLAGGGTRFRFSKRALDVFAFYSMPLTSGGGSSRIGFEFALKPFFFWDKTKGVFVYEMIELKEPIPVKSDRLSLQLMYGF